MKRQQAHPSEDIIGRLTNSGHWDRRYRVPVVPPESDTKPAMQDVVEVLVGMIVILALIVGILMWVAIGQAAGS